MRVGIVCSAFADEGAYWGFSQMGQALAARGHEVVAFFRGTRRHFRAMEQPLEGSRTIESGRGVLRWLRGGNLPLLAILERLYHIGHQPWDALLLMDSLPDTALPFFYARSRGLARLLVVFWSKPLAVQAPGTRESMLSRWTAPVVGWLEEKSMKEADGVIAWSSILYDLLKGRKIPEERTLLVRSGADLRLLPPRNKPDCRKGLGLPEDARVLAYMSTVQSKEILRFLARVLGYVLKFVPKAYLVAVTPRSTWLPDAEPFAGHLIQKENVPYEKISSVLCAADALLLPYSPEVPGYHARWVGRIAEYLACGRPIVTCDVGEIGTYVRENNVGVVSKPDEIAFAHSCMALLKDPDLLEALGRRARQLAEDKHDWSVIAGQVEDFLHRLNRAKQLQDA